MEADYIRRCPSCGTENAPHIMRCVCGALLAGVDLSLPAARSAAPAAKPEPSPAGAPVICRHDDCGQSNPPGTAVCLYCNRPADAGLAFTQQAASLLKLPAALAARYRIERHLPTRGAEAEVLLVREAAGGPLRVAKIYRHGILPDAEVQQRIARVDPAHCVVVLQSGMSDGYAYELMEFCEHGSLREFLPRLSEDSTGKTIGALIAELATAVEAVHAAGLLHRDLKPENILIRTVQPFDLVLTDFGTASLLDATQRFTGVARTLPYASPESLSGMIDGKADYWSLGVIVLEAVLGRHPFAGLSDAVILHHLTTRSIDLAPVANRNLRKLLRGLLLRDPKQRWGGAEIRRWLAGDASLAEPNEPGVAAGFREPYHVGQEICHSNEQLAVALARNWQIGVGDMANGLLLSWFRDVQKDQNAIRVLLGLRNDSKMPLDTQLLTFILHLAPGIPPVWRGESIELPAILERADKALRGDEAAGQWLDKLYQYRVLECYAAAGNADVAEIVRRWSKACDRFDEAWAAGQQKINAKAPARGPDEVVNIDQLMYGNASLGMPAPADMHARLLAGAYDAQWADRQRKRLLAELAQLTAYCPWFADLGDPRTMDAPDLLVLEALLPEARKVRDRVQKSEERAQDASREELQSVRHDLAVATQTLRSAARGNLMLADSVQAVRTQIDAYIDLVVRIKSSQRAEPDWQAMKKTAARNEPLIKHLSLLTDRLAERQAANSGFFGIEALGLAAAASVMLPFFLRGAPIYLLAAVFTGLLAWRVVPVYWMMRKINRLAEKLAA
ncbi:MAG TPA: protein kinase [Burkholderiaceae bacterium]